MASLKDALGSAKTGLSSLSARLPFPKKASAASPEPFASIEDDTPLGDLLSTSNAAPLAKPAKVAGEKVELLGLLRAALKRPAVAIGALAALGLVLVLVVVSALVAAPPKAAAAPRPFTKEGLALVKTWILPGKDPLAPRFVPEREGTRRYGPEDAARLGVPDDPAVEGALAERNDAAIDDLYGTVK
jgi:hypothetical protein